MGNWSRDQSRLRQRDRCPYTSTQNTRPDSPSAGLMQNRRLGPSHKHTKGKNPALRSGLSRVDCSLPTQTRADANFSRTHATNPVTWYTGLRKLRGMRATSKQKGQVNQQNLSTLWKCPNDGVTAGRNVFFPNATTSSARRSRFRATAGAVFAVRCLRASCRPARLRTFGRRNANCNRDVHDYL